MFVSHCETISRSVFFTFHLKDLEGESSRVERERARANESNIPSDALRPPLQHSASHLFAAGISKQP